MSISNKTRNIIIGIICGFYIGCALIKNDFKFNKRLFKELFNCIAWPVKKFEELSSSQKIAFLFALVFTVILVCTIIKNKNENGSMKYTWFIIALVVSSIILAFICKGNVNSHKWFLPIFFTILLICAIIMICISYTKSNKNKGYSIKLYQPVFNTFTKFIRFIFWFLLIGVGIVFIINIPRMFGAFFDEFNKADFSLGDNKESLYGF